MRALKPVINSTVAFLLLAVAMDAAAAQAPAAQTADPQAPASVAVAVPSQEPQSGPSSPATETQSVHVQVGRSIILNTQSRLRRIVVSSPDVLDTATISPTQLVVTAKAAGSSSLVLWDESSNARIVDVYADVDVSGLRDAVRDAYPKEQVEIEAEQGRILVSGEVPSKEVADGILNMVSMYSKNTVDSLIVAPRHVKQIMLKVEFAEVDRTKLQQFGINILSTGASNTIGTTSTGQFSPPNLNGQLSNTIGAPLTGSAQGSFSTNSLLNIFLFRPDLNLGAMIQDLQQKSVLQILAEPTLMARSGEPAKFLAGGEFPFPVVQGGTGTAVSVTIMFKPYGVKLEFTGTIEDNNVIRLKIAPEVSTLDFTNAVTISGFEVPALSTRRAETEIDLKDGQSFGMAGLLDRRETVQLSKMPGIGDIPVLGNLFRSRSVSRSNSELLVMVTPSIVDPAAEPVASGSIPSMPVSHLDDKTFDPTVGSKPAESENTSK